LEANICRIGNFTGRQETLVKDTTVIQGSLYKTGTQTVLNQDGTPLILKKTLGLGEIYYLTFDPNLEPFAGWSGKEAFYRQLFDKGINRPVWGWGFRNWDSAMQAIRILPDDPTPSIYLIIGFIAVYVILIGPVNYWVLRRLKRPGLAWITIPCLSLLFSLAIFIYGAVGNSNQPFLNQMAVVQISPDNNQAHIDGLAGINSPVSTVYSLEAGDGLLIHAFPERSGYGNLLSDHPWMFKDMPGGGTLVESIPINPSGFEAVVIQGQVPTMDMHGELTMQINGNDILLNGSITNNSDITLKDAALLTPWGAQKLETLAAHSSQNIQYHISVDGLQASKIGLARPEGESILTMFTPENKPLSDDLMGFIKINSDPVAEQRKALISAFGNDLGRQGKIYFAGWSTSSPMDLKLSGQTAAGPISTLYLVSISTKTNAAGATIALNPGIFNWQVIQNLGMVNPSPYNAYLGQGKVIFDYKPMERIFFKSVDSLTLHLENNDNAGVVPFTVAFWNWNKQSWTINNDAHWGDQFIASPQSFVSDEGEVRVQIESSRADAPFLKRADISLVVHP
jgi:hypothetical protein